MSVVLTKEQQDAQDQGYLDQLTGVGHISQVPKGEEIPSSRSLYTKNLGVTTHKNLRRMVGLKDGESYTDYYKRTNYIPSGYENEARALMMEEKEKLYEAQWRAGEIGYEDFLMKAYGYDIMKANGDDMTSALYWYNRAKQGIYGSPLDNDYYFKSLIESAETAYEATSWYKEIYSRAAEDTFQDLVTGVTLDADKLADIFPDATEALSDYFDNDLQKMNNYYRAGFLDASAFTPFVFITPDAQGKDAATRIKEGETPDYYYHMDGKLYAVKGGNGSGTKWAELKYDDKGNLDRVVVDGFFGTSDTGAFFSEMGAGIASFWGGVVDIFALAGSGIASWFTDDSFADHYAKYEAWKNGTHGWMGGIGNTVDFGGAFDTVEGGSDGDNIGRGTGRVIGALIPMIILTVCTFGAGGAAAGGAKAATSAASTAASQAASAAAKIATNTVDDIAKAAAQAAVQAVGNATAQAAAQSAALAAAKAVATSSADDIAKAAAKAAADAAVKSMTKNMVSNFAKQAAKQGAEEAVKKGVVATVGKAVKAVPKAILSTAKIMGGFKGGASYISTNLLRHSAMTAGKKAVIAAAERALILGVKDAFQTSVQLQARNRQLEYLRDQGYDVAPISDTHIFLRSLQVGLINTATTFALSATSTTGSMGSRLNTMFGNKSAQGLTEAGTGFLSALSSTSTSGIIINTGADILENLITQSTSAAAGSSKQGWYIGVGSQQFNEGLTQTIKSPSFRIMNLYIGLMDTGLPSKFEGDNWLGRKVAAINEGTLRAEELKMYSLQSVAKTYSQVDAALGMAAKKAADDGDLDAQATWVAVRKQLRMDAEQTKNSAGESMDEAAAIVEALAKLNSAFGSNDSLDGRKTLADIVGRKEFEAFVGPEAYKEISKFELKSQGLVEALGKHNARLMLKDVTIKHMREDYNYLMALANADKDIAKEMFNNEFFQKVTAGEILDAEGNTKELKRTNWRNKEVSTQYGKIQEHIVDVFKGMKILVGERASAAFDLREAMKMAAAQRVGVNMDTLKDEDFNRLFSELFEMDVWNGEMAEEEGVPFMTLNKSLGLLLKNEAALEALKKAGLTALTEDGNSPLFGAVAFTTKHPGARNNDWAGDPKVQAFHKILDGLATVYEKQAPGFNYEQPLLVRVEHKDHEGKPATTYIIPNYSLIERTEYTSIVGGLLKASMTMMFSKDKAQLDEAYKLLSIASQDVALGGTRVFTDDEIKAHSLAYLLNLMGTRDDSGKETGVITQSRMYALVKTGVVSVDTLKEFANMPEYTNAKEMVKYLEDCDKINNEIVPLLEKLKVKDGKKAFTKKEEDRLRSFLISSRDPAERAVLNNLVADGKIGPGVIDYVETLDKNFTSGQRGEGLENVLGSLLKTFSERGEVSQEIVNKYLDIILKDFPQFQSERQDPLTLIAGATYKLDDFEQEVEAKYGPMYIRDFGVPDEDDHDIELNDTQRAALKVVTEALSLIRSPKAFAELKTALKNEHGEINRENNIVRNMLKLLESGLDSSAPEVVAKRAHTDDLLVQSILSVLPSNEDFERRFTLNAIEQLLTEKLVISDQYNLKTDGSYNLIPLLTKNPKLALFLYDRITAANPGMALTQADFMTRPELYLSTYANLGEAVAAGLNVQNDYFVYREIKDLKQRVADYMNQAMDLYYRDTVQLQATNLIRVNLNVLRSKGTEQLTSMVVNAAALESMGHGESKTIKDWDTKKAVYGERELQRYRRAYQKSNGQIVFDMNNSSERASFISLMKAAGYSGEEILSAKYSKVPGVYAQLNPTRAVKLEGIKANELKVKLQEASKAITTRLGAGKQLDIGAAIEELAGGYTRLSPDMTLSYPGLVLSPTGKVTIESLALSQADTISADYPKIGVRAGKGRGDFVERELAAWGIDRQPDTIEDGIANVITIFDTASRWIGEGEKTPDRLLTSFSQEVVNREDARLLVEQFKDNPIWLVTQQKKEKGKPYVLNISLRKGIKADEFFDHAMKMYFTDGGYRLTDVIPVFNWNDRIGQGSSDDAKYNPVAFQRLKGGEDVNLHVDGADHMSLTSFIRSNYDITLDELRDIAYKSEEEIRGGTNYSYDIEAYKAIFEKGITLEELHRIASESDNYFVKRLAAKMKQQQEISDILSVGGAYDLIAGDPTVRNTIGNELNNIGFTRYEQVRNITDEQLTKVAESVVKTLKTKRPYTGSTETHNELYSKDIVSDVSRMPLSVESQDVDIDEVKLVLKELFDQLHDQNIHTTKGLVFNIPEHNAAQNILHLLRFTEDGVFVDIDSLSLLSNKDVELLKQIIPDFDKTILREKLYAQESDTAVHEARLANFNGDNASVILQSVGFDDPEIQNELKAILISKLQNQRVKTSLKVSSLAEHGNKEQALVERQIKEIENTIGLVNDKFASTIITDVNNRIAFGELELSRISLAEHILETYRDDSGVALIPVKGLTEEQRREHAYEIARGISIYSSGLDSQADWGKYAVYDPKAPAGKRFRLLASHTGHDQGVGNLYKNILTNDVVYDKNGNEVQINTSFLTRPKTDDRESLPILITLSKNALQGSYGTMNQKLTWSEMNEKTLDRLVQGMVHYAVEEMRYRPNKISVDDSTTEILSVILSQKRSTYERNMSLINLAKNEYEMPDEVARQLVITVALASSRSPDYAAREDAFFNTLAKIGAAYGVDPEDANAFAQAATDIIAFAVNKHSLPQEVFDAFTNKLQDLDVDVRVKDLSRALFAPALYDADGKSIYKETTPWDEARIKSLIINLKTEYEAEGLTEEQANQRLIQELITYTVLDRKRGKDINAIFNGESLSTIMQKFADAETAKRAQYTTFRMANGDNLDNFLQRGYLFKDTEAFYEPGDKNHDRARPYHFSAVNFDGETDYTKEPKVRNIVNVYIDYNDDYMLKQLVDDKDNAAMRNNPTGLRKSGDISSYTQALKHARANGYGVEFTKGNTTTIVFQSPMEAQGYITKLFDAAPVIIGKNSNRYDDLILEKHFGINHTPYIGKMVDSQEDFMQAMYSDIDRRKLSQEHQVATVEGTIKSGQHTADVDNINAATIMFHVLDKLENTEKMKAVLGSDILKIVKAVTGSEDISILKGIDNTIVDLHKEIGNLAGGAGKRYIQQYSIYGNNLDNEKLRAIESKINDNQANIDYRVLMKKYSEKVEDIAGESNLAFVRAFKDEKKVDATAKLFSSLVELIKPELFTLARHPDKLTDAYDTVEGAVGQTAHPLNFVAQMIAGALKLENDGNAPSVERVNDFFLSDTEEQLSIISRYVKEKANEDVRYKNIPLLTDEQLQSAIEATSLNNGQYARDFAQGMAELDFIGINEALEFNSAMVSYAMTMRPIYDEFMKDMPDGPIKNEFYKEFAKIYGRTLSDEEIEEKLKNRKYAIELTSAFSDQLKELVADDRDITVTFTGKYGMVSSVDAGRQIKDINGNYHTAGGGTIFVSEAFFKHLSGGADYNSVLKAVGEPGDTVLYTQIERQPGVAEAMHSVRLVVAHKSESIDNIAMEGNYLRAMGGDFDGDKITAISPSRQHHAYGKAMYELNQPILEASNKIFTIANSAKLSDIDIKDMETASRVLSQDVEDTYRILISNAYDNQQVRDILTELKQKFEDLLGKEQGKKAWDMYGIKAYVDVKTNATEGGYKFYSYHPDLNIPENRQARQNRVAAGHIFYDLTQANSSAPGASFKQQVYISEELTGKASQITRRSPINVTDTTVAKLNIALEDPAARAEIERVVLKATPKAIHKHVLALIKDGDASSIITALQLIDLEYRNTDTFNSSVAKTISSINSDQRFEQERAKLKQLELLLQSKGRVGDGNYDPTNFMDMRRYRGELFKILGYSNDYLFGGDYSPNIQRAIAQHIIDGGDSTSLNHTKVFDNLRDADGIEMIDETGAKVKVPYVAGKEYVVVLDADMEDDSFESLAGKNYGIGKVEHIEMPTGFRLTKEGEAALRSDSVIKAGTKLTTDPNEVDHMRDYKVIGFLDSDGQITKDLDRARTLLISSLGKIGDEGGTKIVMAGGSALKTTHRGTRKFKAAAGYETPDFFVSAKQFNAKKMSYEADWKPIEIVDADGKKYMALKTTIGLAEAPVFWHQQRKTSELDPIFIANGSNAVDSVLQIGQEYFTVNKDGTLTYSTKFSAAMEQAKLNAKIPVYTDTNAAQLYGKLRVYSLIMNADDKLFAKHMGLNILPHEMRKIKEGYYQKLTNNKLIGGEYASLVINTILSECYAKPSDFDAIVTKDKFLSALWSSEMADNFSNAKPISHRSRKDGEYFYSKTKGYRSIPTEDRFHAKNISYTGDTVIQNAMHYAKDGVARISASSSFYPMRDFINNLLFMMDSDKQLSKHGLQVLTERGVLNTPYMHKGSFPTQYRPFADTEALEVDAAGYRGTIDPKTGTSKSDVKQKVSMRTRKALNNAMLTKLAQQYAVTDGGEDRFLKQFQNHFGPQRTPSNVSVDGSLKFSDDNYHSVSKYRVMQRLIAALSGAQSELGRAKFLSSDPDALSNYATINTSRRTLNVNRGSGELGFEYDVRTQANVELDDVKNRLLETTGSYMHFRNQEEDKASIERNLKGSHLARPGVLRTAYADDGEGLMRQVNDEDFTTKAKSVLETVDGAGIRNFRQITDDDQGLVYDNIDSFEAQRTFMQFMNEELGNTEHVDTDIEVIAKKWTTLAGDDIYRMKKSRLASGGVKAGDNSVEGRTQALKIDRAIVEFRSESRVLMNQMLGDEYRLLSENMRENNKNFNRYMFYTATLSKLDYMDSNRESLSKELKTTESTFDAIRESIVKDLGVTIDEARAWMGRYEKIDGQGIAAVQRLNARVQTLANQYAKLTGQPYDNQFWFMMPIKEASLPGNKKGGHRVLIHKMTSMHHDKRAVMENSPVVFEGYNYMAAIYKSVEELSSIIAITRNAQKLTSSGAMNSTVLMDIAQRNIVSLFDSMNLNVGSTKFSDDNMHEYRLYAESIQELGIDYDPPRRATVGECWGQLYKDLNDLVQSDGTLGKLSYSELLNVWRSSEGDSKAAAEKMLSIRAAMNDILVKLAMIQDKDGKANQKNILVRILNEAVEAAGEDKVLVDRFGRQIDFSEDGVKSLLALSENSMDHFVQLYRYTSEPDGGRANIALDILNGDVYLMDKTLAEVMAKNVFTRVTPGPLRRATNFIKNTVTRLIMGSPIKLMSRMVNFSMTDLSFAMTAHPGTVKELSAAMRELRAFRQSNGAALSEDLREYIYATGSGLEFDSIMKDGSGMYRGETVGRMKGNNPISAYYNLTNDAFTLQTMYVRFAMFKSLKKSFDKSTTKTGEIPAWKLGASYRYAEELNRLEGIKSEGDLNNGVSKNAQVALKVISDTMGNIGDMPALASKLSNMGMMFTTFPLALVRFGMNELSSTALAVRNIFTDGGTGRGDAAKYLLHQAGSILSIYVLSALFQYLFDSERRKAFNKKLTGDELTEEDEEHVQGLLFGDKGILKPFESIFAGEPVRNRKLQINPYATLQEMFYNPFKNGAEGKDNYGYEAGNKGVGQGFLNFFNENIFSHLWAPVTAAVESNPSNQSIGYTFGNEDYSWLENIARKVSGYALGGEYSAAFFRDMETSNYEDMSFIQRLGRGATTAFRDELSNTPQYKSSWKNYRKAFNTIYNWKALNNTVVDASYDVNYDDLSTKLKQALQNQNTPTAFYNIIAEAKQNGIALSTIRSAVNNVSLRYKIQNLSDVEGFWDSLSDSEENIVRSAIAYEQYMFPFLDEYMEDIETEYQEAKREQRMSQGYSTYNRNPFSGYYNGYFHDLPSFGLSDYYYQSGTNNYNRQSYARNSTSGYSPGMVNPYDAYINAKKSLLYKQQEIERAKWQKR